VDHHLSRRTRFVRLSTSQNFRITFV
jgi:hypothetical protein